MIIRKRIEEEEKRLLSPYAMKSVDSVGRRKEEESCEIRTCYQRDRDRIVHSKAFRRLKHKTQVYISPEGDHYRTRLTHTLEVTQIARTIAKALQLNEDLTEAIALAHDLGHTPFGHMGEDILNHLNPNGFKHYEQSLRVVDFLEAHNKDCGLNLSEEVRDGIVNHTGDHVASTLEGRIIKFSDRIAYINHDIDDAQRAGLLREEDLPEAIVTVLGNCHGDRIHRMIYDVIEHSYGKNEVSMSEPVYQAMMNLRSFLFQNVYLTEYVRRDEEKIQYIIQALSDYYTADFSRLPMAHRSIYEKRDQGVPFSSKEDIICDYIAGMTDSYAIRTFKETFIPKPWMD